MVSEPLRRCLRLHDLLAARTPSPTGYALTPLRLENLQRALITEGGPIPTPGLAAVLAEPAADETARILALLREVPRD